MRLLDRYLCASFAKAFLASLVVFSVSAVTLDFFGRLGYFANADQVAGTFAESYSGVKIVFLFYLAYLPFLLKQVLPFITLAAALFTVSGMLRGNEVLPVLAAGVSARRLFAPVFLCGAVVALGQLAFQEYAIPALNREHIALKRFFSGDRRPRLDNLAHLRDGRGTVTRVGGYAFSDRNLYDVVIHRPWQPAGFERWIADRLEPDGAAWRAHPAGAGVRILPPGIGELPRRLAPGSRVDFGVSPDEVEALASKQGTAEISFSQLRHLAQKFPQRRNLLVALHKQIARPLTSVVLMLLGVPVLLGAGRSLFLGGALAFGLSACFYLLEILCQSLGDRGDLPPAVAAYVPLVVFFSLGVARLATVRT